MFLYLVGMREKRNTWFWCGNVSEEDSWVELDVDVRIIVNGPRINGEGVGGLGIRVLE